MQPHHYFSETVDTLAQQTLPVAADEDIPSSQSNLEFEPTEKNYKSNEDE
jgi:hypothetical protein